MKGIYLIFLFAAIASFGQNASLEVETGPQMTNAQNEIVEGIVLVEGGIPLDKVHKERGVSIDLNGNFEDLKQSLIELLDTDLNDDFISLAKQKIVSYFRQYKQQYVFVVVPVQEIREGIIVLQVIEGRIGEISFIGQKWFSENGLRRLSRICEEDPLSEDTLLNELSWFNKNPFRSTQLVLAKGQEKGLTNIEFITKDRFPARFYVGADNTGFQVNEEARVFGGASWGNAFMMGDILSYQYTASPDFHHFQSHVVNYSMFLPWKHLFNVFGCYGQVYPKISPFTTSGISVQASARYQVPILPMYGKFKSSYEAGFDYKLLNSNLFFAGDVFQEGVSNSGYITVTQFLASYSLQRNWIQSVFNFKADCYFSIWENWWLPHQTPDAYDDLRQGSHVRYAYWKALLVYQYETKNKWALLTRFRGQVATGTLPTTEQFGLGGADTVRGYYEQQFVADNAVCCNAELYTPPFPIFCRYKNQLAFLTFIDYGYGYNYTSAAGPQFTKQNLLGVGTGLRYDIPPYMNLKADYGFQVFGIPQDHRFGRFHLSLVVSY